MQLYATLIKKIEDNHSNMTSLELITFKGEGPSVKVSIEGNSTSSGLYLYDNDFTNVVAPTIARVLKTNCTLVSFSYSIDRIAPSTVHAFAEALQCNRKLEKLQLCKALLGDDGVITLIKSLTMNSFLSCIDFGINQIGNAGAIALAQFLEANLTITVLKLYRNQIGVAGGRAFVKALEKNPTLVQLNLEGNYLKEEDKQAIKILLKRNNEAMLQRRQQFIAGIISLAGSTAVPNQLYSFGNLPGDVKRYLLRFLNFHGKDHIGKSSQQVHQCAEFVFNNYEECRYLIKQRQKIILIEKTNGTSNYQFAFFKPTLAVVTEGKDGLENHRSQNTQVLRGR